MTSFVAFQDSFQPDAFQEYSDSAETHAGTAISVLVEHPDIFVATATNSRVVTTREDSECADGV